MKGAEAPLPMRMTDRAGTIDIGKTLAAFERRCRHFGKPVVDALVERRRDPYLVLCSTLLSLRTKDEVTALAQERLFALADTPEKMVTTPVEAIAEAIYPVGFYQRKAENLVAVARILLERHGGRVPADLETLLDLPGVGRKTANLVLTMGYGLPGICVDTHVHRIMNRLGYVKSRTPDDTEGMLRTRLPRRWWIPVNGILVAWGRNVCKPLSPLCSICPVDRECPKVGVGRRR